MRGMKWISGSGTHGCWLGSYEYEKQRLFDAAIPPHGTVWDVGANVGLYTLLASRKAVRVIAVEPLPDNIRFLEKHLRLNRITNVEVLAAAVGQECARQSFCIGENRSVGHLGEDGFEVDVITLDLLCAKNGPPDVIKIDVEGTEYLALLGASLCLTTKPTIFLATHSVALAEQCSSLLYHAGYVKNTISEDEFVFTQAESGAKLARLL